MSSDQTPRTIFSNHMLSPEGICSGFWRVFRDVHIDPRGQCSYIESKIWIFREMSSKWAEKWKMSSTENNIKNWSPQLSVGKIRSKKPFPIKKLHQKAQTVFFTWITFTNIDVLCYLGERVFLVDRSTKSSYFGPCVMLQCYIWWNMTFQKFSAYFGYFLKKKPNVPYRKQCLTTSYKQQFSEPCKLSTVSAMGQGLRK